MRIITHEVLTKFTRFLEYGVGLDPRQAQTRGVMFGTPLAGSATRLRWVDLEVNSVGSAQEMTE